MTKINFITLSVRDLALAERFYTSVFGFPVSERSDALCLFELEDNFSLVLQQHEDFLNQADYTHKDGPNSSGFILSQYAASKEIVDTLVAKAVAHGAQKVKVMDESWGYSVTFKDPDGHHWEIVHIIPES